MELVDPYGFVVQRSDDDMQKDHDLVHEHCGTVITRIEPGDSIGTLISLMNEHDCSEMAEPEVGDAGTGHGAYEYRSGH
jgi:hypothetical protein